MAEQIWTRWAHISIEQFPALIKDEGGDLQKIDLFGVVIKSLVILIDVDQDKIGFVLKLLAQGQESRVDVYTGTGIGVTEVNYQILIVGLSILYKFMQMV